jgi:hypothetical protein
VIECCISEDNRISGLRISGQRVRTQGAAVCRRYGSPKPAGSGRNHGADIERHLKDYWDRMVERVTHIESKWRRFHLSLKGRG